MSMPRGVCFGVGFAQEDSPIRGFYTWEDEEIAERGIGLRMGRLYIYAGLKYGKA